MWLNTGDAFVNGMRLRLLKLPIKSGERFFSFFVYSYFEKGCLKKCARDNPETKVIMGYDQYTVPDTAAVEPTFFFLSLALADETSMASRAILSNFFEEQ